MVSSTGVLTAIYKIGFQRDNKRESKYYEEILNPFICVYKRNQTVNAIKFLKNIIKDDNDFIPKYIFLLMKENEEEKLKKVLICDYCELYRNEDNKVKQIMRIVLKATNYILILFALFMVFLGGKYFSDGLMDIGQHLKDIFAEKEWEHLVNIKNGIVFWGMSFAMIWLALLLNKDRYTLKKRKANKIINKAVKIYDNKINNIIL